MRPLRRHSEDIRRDALPETGPVRVTILKTELICVLRVILEIHCDHCSKLRYGCCGHVLCFPLKQGLNFQTLSRLLSASNGLYNYVFIIKSKKLKAGTDAGSCEKDDVCKQYEPGHILT